MTQREKGLAAAVALLLVLWGGTQGLDRYRAALEDNRSLQRNAQQRLAEAFTSAAAGRFAQRKIARWQKQSLPSDHDIALSAYQDWLHEQLVAAGLSVKSLNERNSVRGASPTFRQFTFVVEAEGKLADLTTFLHGFYQAPHLHRISKASFSPTSNGEALDISLAVDALSLNQSDRTDRLAEGTSDRDLRPLDELQKLIVGRNVFAAYSTAKPTESTETATDDQAKQAVVTRMAYGEGGWQMSIRLGDSGEIKVFREGDTIEIGRFAGTLEQLDGRRAVVSNESGRLQIRLGQNLSEAVPLGDQEAG